MADDARPPFLDRPTPSLSAWFDPPTDAAWEAAAQAVLKGRSLDRLAAWLPGGIRMPVVSDGVPDPGPVDAAPFTRVGSDRTQTGWDVRARVDRGDAVQVAADARHALALGARSVALGVGPEGADLTPDRLAEALAPVDPMVTPVDLDVADGVAWREAFLAWAAPAGADATGALVLDPVRDAVAGTPWHGEHVSALADHLDALSDHPWIHGLGLSALAAETSGADPVTAMAMVLAGLDGVWRAGVTVPWARVLVRMAAPQDPFAGAAAFRAMRSGIARLAVVHGVALEGRPFLHATAHPGEQTRVEPWTNALRGTGSLAGAVWGGADAVTVLARDHLAGGSDAARRLALTTHAVLSGESHLAAVADPGGGSRHLEALTDRIARAVWAAASEIVAAGGLSAWTEAGGLSDAIASAQAARTARVATRRDAIVGVSRYGRPGAERLPSSSSSIVRNAAPFEAIRDRVVAHGSPVRVALVTVGSVGRHRGRAGFAADWYAAAGIETVEVSSEDADHDWAGSSGVLGACVCGHDEDYPAVVPGLLAAWSHLPYRAVAGAPGEHEAAWRAAGLSDVLVLGADAVEGLSRALDQMGVAPLA